MFDIIAGIATQSWLVLGQMAPYLLFGFLAAGVLSVLISPDWIERHLGKPGLGPVLKASLYGVPLPLCSCSVIPVSVSMRHHGASRSATTAFLLSTPQTGVDSIAVTYALLGPVFAIFRPLAALLTGLCGGSLVRWFVEAESQDDQGTEKSKSDACTEACCSGAEQTNRLARIFRYGLITLPRDIGLALLAGILIAGVMAALVPQDYFAAYIGGGVLSILLMMAAGVPVYVCATASVPIAAGLIHMGGSPGAALAFLIAGPATNAASFTTIWKALGGRSATVYLLTVGVSALGFGLLLDWLMPVAAMSLPRLAGHAHVQSEGGWPYHISAVVLLVIMLYSYISKSHSRNSTGNWQKNSDMAITSDKYDSDTHTVTPGCCDCSEGSRHDITEEKGD